MNQSYSERRAGVLFTASRELRRIAAAILDDVVEEAEFTGRSAGWAKNQAATTARLANDLAHQAYEQTGYVSPHTEAANARVGREYSKAIDRFESRARSYGVDPESITDAAAAYAA